MYNMSPIKKQITGKFRWWNGWAVPVSFYLTIYKTTEFNLLHVVQKLSIGVQCMFMLPGPPTHNAHARCTLNVVLSA